MNCFMREHILYLSPLETESLYWVAYLSEHTVAVASSICYLCNRLHFMSALSCITFWPRQRCINLQVDKWPFWNVLDLKRRGIPSAHPHRLHTFTRSSSGRMHPHLFITSRFAAEPWKKVLQLPHLPRTFFIFQKEHETSVFPPAAAFHSETSLSLTPTPVLLNFFPLNPIA